MRQRRNQPRFEVSPAIAHREIGGTLMLLLPGDSRLYAFNDTGRLVWRGLLRKRSAASIAATIARTFRIPLPRAERDVHDLLEDLLRRGAIRRL